MHMYLLPPSETSGPDGTRMRFGTPSQLDILEWVGGVKWHANIIGTVPATSGKIPWHAIDHVL